MLTVHEVPYGDAAASRLWAEVWAELADRYGELTDTPELDPAGMVASLVGFVDDEPVACVVVRLKAYDGNPAAAEIKRMYVAPDHRGKGFSRVLMGAAEEAAWRSGATRIILETGSEQPEAVALYRAIGYEQIPPYGDYQHNRRSLCFAKELPTRVLVVNGTIGAGKTAVASAIGDVLDTSGAMYAWIDADALCQATPTDPEDVYSQGLLFDALGAVAPVYRRRGLGIIVVARVVEDALDRERYARAFHSNGGAADVAIVRVAASEATRLARIDAREPEGRWRRWSRARTVELEDSLNALDLDDYTIENDGRGAPETAAAVLEAIGWTRAPSDSPGVPA